MANQTFRLRSALLVALSIGTILDAGTNWVNAAIQTNQIEQEGQFESTYTVMVKMNIVRNKAYQQNGAILNTGGDVTLVIRDGAGGANTEITPGMCWTGANNMGQTWEALGQRLLRHEGRRHVYRWSLRHIGAAGATGGGAMKCEYTVKLKNAKNPGIQVIVPEYLFEWETGTRRGVSKIVGMSVGVPDNTHKVATIGTPGGQVNANTPDVRGQASNMGELAPAMSTTVIAPRVSATVRYEDNVVLNVGEKKDDVFVIDGEGVGAVRWKWSYVGDTRLFNLVDSRGTVIQPNQDVGYTNPVGVHAYTSSKEWGSKTGVVDITYWLP